MDVVGITFHVHIFIQKLVTSTVHRNLKVLDLCLFLLLSTSPPAFLKKFVIEQYHFLLIFRMTVNASLFAGRKNDLVTVKSGEQSQLSLRIMPI